jgi:DNA mismatch endonuclease (patch repair protein)
VEFWETKFEQNVRRDRRNEAALRKRGWRIIRIWECETESFEALARLIRSRMKV